MFVWDSAECITQSKSSVLSSSLFYSHTGMQEKLVQIDCHLSSCRSDRNLTSFPSCHLSVGKGEWVVWSLSFKKMPDLIANAQWSDNDALMQRSRKGKRWRNVNCSPSADSNCRCSEEGLGLHFEQENHSMIASFRFTIPKAVPAIKKHMATRPHDFS